jgi:hypothetical protein
MPSPTRVTVFGHRSGETAAVPTRQDDILRSSRTGRPQQRPIQAAGSKAFPAVSVSATSECCAAAKALAGRRILAVHAPRLPLEDCTRPAACRCRFTKFVDRRDDGHERRHEGKSMRSVLYSGQERRRAPGRRRGD